MTYNTHELALIEAFKLKLLKVSNTDICLKMGITPKMLQHIKQNECIKKEFPEHTKPKKVSKDKSTVWAYNPEHMWLTKEEIAKELGWKR